jgi:large subunit ribosomal protein L3
MTQIFAEDGKVVPVTVIEAGPCTVTQKKTTEKDGYSAIQIGFGDVSPKGVNKPRQGHFKKNDLPFKRFLREFRSDNTQNTGDVLKAGVFAVGDMVDVSGTGKGKGFQGTIKRHNQHRIDETHGAGPVHRHAGSMGANSDPSRIFKGKKLPGHMGAKRVTVQNLTVVKVDNENNLIAVKGAVPGPKGGLVRITSAVKSAGNPKSKS